MQCIKYICLPHLVTRALDLNICMVEGIQHVSESSAEEFEQIIGPCTEHGNIFICGSLSMDCVNFNRQSLCPTLRKCLQRYLRFAQP